MANPLLQDDANTSVRFWGTVQGLVGFNSAAMGTERRSNGAGPWAPYDCLGGAEGLVFSGGTGTTVHNADVDEIQRAAD